MNRNIDEYLRLLHDCNRPTDVKHLTACKMNAIDTIIDGMTENERRIITLAYSLKDDSSKSLTIPEIVSKLSWSEHRVTYMLRDIRSILAYHIENEPDEIRIRLTLRDINLPPKIADRLEKYYYVSKLVEFEQEHAFMEILGISNADALKIYTALSPYYEISDFAHYDETIKLSQYDPYTELIYDMFGRGDYEVPYSSHSLVDNVISELRPREQFALRKYYGLDTGIKLTYQKLGELYFRVGVERARQIVARAQRGLRHPARGGKRLVYIAWPRERLIEEYIKLNQLRSNIRHREKALLQREQEMTRREQKIADQIKLAIANCEACHYKTCPILSIDEGHVISEPNILEMSIEELDLSVRSYNILKRHGVYSVEDILKYKDLGGLMSIRNMGRKSAEEVLQKLDELFLDNNPMRILSE